MSTSVKEYIGARYVPLFYDDGQGGAEWNQNVRYEPLTIVTREGNSYTSRQYVPEGVALTDTRYWLETGNWNSQVESYRQEVMEYMDDIERAQETADGAAAAAQAARTTANSAVATANSAQTTAQSASTTATAAQTAAGNATTAANAAQTAATNASTAAAAAQTTANTANTAATAAQNKLTAVQKRGIFSGKLITIGDSYDAGWTPDGNVTGWGSILYSISGATGHVDKNQGGCGFVTVNSGKNFYILLQEAVASIPAAQRGDYTAVVIGGGFNDGGATPSQALEAITNCSNYVKNNLPNAQLVIAFIPWSRYPDTVGGPNRRNTLRSYERGLIGNTCRFIADAYMALAIDESSRMSSDGRHPTQAGQNAIAQHILAVCQGGEMEYVLPDIALANDMIANVKNKMLELNKFGNGFIVLDNVSAGFWNGRKFGEITLTTDLPFDPPSTKDVYNGVQLAGAVQCTYNGATVFRTASITLRITRKNKISVYLLALNDGGTNWLGDAYVPNAIVLPQGCLQFPVMDL